MFQGRLPRAFCIPPSMLPPEIFEWLRLRRVLCQLSVSPPNLSADSVPPSGLYLNIYPPGQILETLSVFPASAQSSLAQWHQDTNGQHQRISFGFPGRLVDEGTDACVVIIM